MRRLLQLAGNVSLASSRNNNIINLSSSLGFAASRRPISISSAYARQLDGSSSSSSSSSGGKKKKGLLKIASETIANIGSKPNNKRPSDIYKPRSKAATSVGQKTRDSLSGGSQGKMVQTRSGYDTRQRKGSMSREKSPSSIGINGEIVRDGDHQYKGPKDHRSMSSVRHDKDAHRFILDLGNNQVARIDYKTMGKNKIELYHTEVPDELRGRGIGKTLAKGALECASKDNYKLKVTCEYLQDYLKRFADDKYKRLVEN